MHLRSAIASQTLLLFSISMRPPRSRECRNRVDQTGWSRSPPGFTKRFRKRYPAEFYERVREADRELAAREPNRVVLINGLHNADQIENEIWETLSNRFPNQNPRH